MKGTMQVDYALAIFIFLILFGIIVNYNARILKTLAPVTDDTVHFSDLVHILYGLFYGGMYNSTGSSLMMSNVYVCYVNVTPTSEKNLTISLKFPKTVTSGSVRVYDENLTEVPSNVTYFNAGDVNVTIRTSGGFYIVEANDEDFSTPNYGVDLSNPSTGSYYVSNYTTMSVFDMGKFDYFNQSNYSDDVAFMGIKHFLITVGGARFGENVFATGNVYSTSVSTIALNSTGGLERVNVNVKTW